tara:strand:+ start:279 stop:1145 length:867 start_codon:yes stop_codon:yes gene_type:complete
MYRWIIASRPKTLIAAIAPVILGSSLAFQEDSFNLLLFTVILITAILIQIGTNLVNDLFDYINGADNEDRLGPDRALQKGLLSKSQIESAIFFIFTIAVVLGFYLALIGGWPIVIIGSISILFGFLYTSGPYPLAYNGLGDIFVFIFFGLVSVSGTYYLYTGNFYMDSIILGSSVGSISTGILVVNNLRDIYNDKKFGKNTLAVLLGKRFTQIEYLLLMIIAYLIPIYISFIFGWKSSLYIVYFTLPIAIQLILQVFFKEGADLNKTLEGTAKLLLLYTLLLSFGIVI